MNKTIAKNLLIGGLLLFIGMNQVHAGEKTIKLQEVSAFLAKYEGTENDYIKDTVVYREIGMSKYDAFFKEAALTYGSLVQLHKTMTKSKAGELEESDEFATLTMAFAVEQAVNFGTKLTDLEAQISSLDPKADFKGLDKRKAPEATQGIGIASKQLAISTQLLMEINDMISQ